MLTSIFPNTSRSLSAAVAGIGTALLLSWSLHSHAQAMPGAAPALKPLPAVATSAATVAPMLGAARAGERLVAVGDYGIVLLSDDGGAKFRQAAAVPVSSTLTAVSFVDAKEGWAVGHWGAILHTADGGEHWEIQRLSPEEDRPLFSVHFFDAQHGVAVGLWSLVLTTADGGKSWNPVTLPAPPEGGRGDRNLFKAFPGQHGELYVAAERGAVLKTTDRGATWSYLNTGYKGSFWSGVTLADGTLLVGGLRGNIYRSADGGKSWQAADSGTHSSITDLQEIGGKVVGVALDGVQLESTDHGQHFTVSQRGDRLSLTAVQPGKNGTVRFSRRGVVADSPAKAGVAPGKS